MIGRRLWPAAVACLALQSACATTQHIAETKPDEEVTAQVGYAPGQEKTAYVGDALVKARNYRTSISPAGAVKADQAFVLSGGIDRIHFKAGETLDIVDRRRGADGRTILIAEKENTYRIQVEEDGRVLPVVLSDIGFGVRAPMLARFRVRPEAARLSPVRPRKVEADGFGDNYDLLFAGADDHALHFTLREYWRDDLDRPALQQEIHFPATARLIHLRGLAITVREATADRLVYSITSTD